MNSIPEFLHSSVNGFPDLSNKFVLPWIRLDKMSYAGIAEISPSVISIYLRRFTIRIGILVYVRLIIFRSRNPPRYLVF